MEIVARVLLAVSSPLIRVRLRHAIAPETRLHVIGEAADGGQAAELIQEQKPNLLLFDDRMILHPAVQALYANVRGKPHAKAVLVTPNVRATTNGGNVPIAAVVQIDLPAEELTARIVASLSIVEELDLIANQGPSDAVRKMQTRFMIVEDAPPEPKAPTSMGGTGGLRRNPTRDLIDRTRGLTSSRLSAPTSVERRLRKETHETLTAILQSMQTREDQEQRDTLTGLPNKRALGMALNSLPRANQPAAVMVVDIWHTKQQPMPNEVTPASGVIRKAGHILRANVRQGDLLCRLDGLTFAIIMPGVDRTSSASPVRRLRNALTMLRLSLDPDEGEPAVSIGVGFWGQGQPPAFPLQRAWESMIAERESDR